MDILRNKWTHVAAAGVVSFAGGVVTGYILSKRKAAQDDELTPEQEAAIEEALRKVFEESPIVTNIDQNITVETPLTAEELAYRVSELNTRPTPPSKQHDVVYDTDPEPQEDAPADVIVQPEINNVFRVNGPNEEWDYDTELAKREQARAIGEPYIISAEEFIQDEKGYQQETLTYYRGDDIMGDQNDTPIYNYQNLMGELKFGHGSKDPNVVYIRNEKVHMEWEILLHQGSFEVEVMGFEIERTHEKADLKHSVEKFRQE